MKIKPEHYKVLVKVFEYYGCIYIRTNGDHMVFHCPEAVRPVVIPKYDEVPVFIIKNNMKNAGMSRKLYFEILSKI